MTLFACCKGANDNTDDTYVISDTKNNYNNNDLTKDPIRHSTIEELKSKLEAKELANEEFSEDMITETQRGIQQPQQAHLNEDGLIMPRKPHNPILDNTERQNLHKELMFNKKIGKNVLNQKSELQKVLAKHKDNIAKKEMESTIAAKTPELQKVIAGRAKRLEEGNAPSENEDKGVSKEFLQARAKLKARADSK